MASTAEYSKLPDGKIRVVNRCHKDRLDGPLKESVGKAEVVDDQTNAKLKVWFFWPFKGNYWIIDLDDDYQWAVVGVQIFANRWIHAGQTTAALFDVFGLAGQSVHIRRRPTQIGNHPGKARCAVANLFDLANDGVFRATLNNPPFVFSD